MLQKLFDIFSLLKHHSLTEFNQSKGYRYASELPSISFLVSQRISSNISSNSGGSDKSYH